MTFNTILEADLHQIVSNTQKDMEAFRNKTIFITGGTGFVGKWLLYSLVYANDTRNLAIKIIVLTRNVDLFVNNQPYLADKNIKFIKGDVRTFCFPNEDVDFVIHAATEANAKMNVENPFEMVDVIIDGTKRVLLFAKERGVKKFLFLSSGAVYGNMARGQNHFNETDLTAPDPLNISSAYGEAKRMAEFFCFNYSKTSNINISIARCFAFVGPFLPLDTHFAIGNFINDGLNKRDITIHGDGLPLRSYLYASDMVEWLFSILINSKSGDVYNVGSDKAISIKELANALSTFFSGTKVILMNQTRSTDRNLDYVPNVSKIISQLNMSVRVSLNEAIEKTIKYHQLLRV